MNKNAMVPSKFTKSSKIDLTMEGFRANFYQFLNTFVAIFFLGGLTGNLPLVPSISSFFKKDV